MKRVFDITFSILLTIVLLLPLSVIAIIVSLTSNGPILYWSERVGTNNQTFRMPKFRSMKIETPQLATHLLINSNEYLTDIGKFIRKYSLDELPQLFSILIGDMSLVGPRPALFNQYDLIELRTVNGVHTLKPGLTGWAQINGRDDIDNTKKVEYDKYYLENQRFLFDMKIIFLTILKALRGEGIKH